jgi:hypothetical protein
MHALAGVSSSTTTCGINSTNPFQMRQRAAVVAAEQPAVFKGPLVSRDCCKTFVIGKGIQKPSCLHAFC